LLNPGHIRLLEQARNYGDILVVGVLSDASARARPSAPPRERIQRPITPAGERSEVLAALAAVDYVFEFEVSKLPDLLTEMQPDVAVEGAGPSSLASLSSFAAKAAGLPLVRIPLEPGHSTRRLIERIAQLGA
jgi:cytidyltransferase-like protein